MFKKMVQQCLALLFAGAVALSPLAQVAPTVAYAQSGSSQSSSSEPLDNEKVGEDGLTDYQRQQQNLPLSQRDKLIAEPKLMVAAVVLLVWFVWKIRRDLQRKKEQEAAALFQRDQSQMQPSGLEADFTDFDDDNDDHDEGDEGDEDDEDESDED